MNGSLWTPRGYPTKTECALKPENIAKIDEMWRRLPDLEKAGEAALRAARRSKKEMGAVNWGDLHVHDTGIKISQISDIGFYMLIEEASPDAYGLCLYLNDYLRKRGFENVQVTTEW